MVKISGGNQSDLFATINAGYVDSEEESLKIKTKCTSL
nr:MAG TPA: hypothetical protein [Caudoviricetes sp.]